MWVKAIRNVHEGTKFYPKKTVFEVEDARAETLIGLEMVVEATEGEAEKAQAGPEVDKAMTGGTKKRAGRTK